MDTKRRILAYLARRRSAAGGDLRSHVGSSRRSIEEIFSEFAPEEYDFRFQKTKMLVKLLQRDFVSRSEAKRLVANLDKFSEIVLDFRDVKSVGQGFADEVFRVFARRHPAVKIATENTNPGVDAMIRHVRSQ